MNIIKTALILFTLSLFGIASELVTFKSHLDMNKTISNLKKSLPKNGLNLISKIDMSKWARRAGVNLNKEFILSIGNPYLDAQILQNDPRAALELPIKIVIYKDFKDDVWVVYKNPNSYKSIYRLNKCNVLSQFDNRLKKSIKEAIEIKIAKIKISKDNNVKSTKDSISSTNIK